MATMVAQLFAAMAIAVIPVVMATVVPVVMIVAVVIARLSQRRSCHRERSSSKEYGGDAFHGLDFLRWGEV